MISTLVKHFVFERALDVFFNAVQKNIISWRAQDVVLSNIRKVTDTESGSIHYSTYYEGKFIKTEITLEVIQDLSAMHGITDEYIDSMMTEALQFEAMASVMTYEQM